MDRPFRELLEDYAGNPAQWEVVQTNIEPSTNLGNKGGSSITEILRHRSTGEEMERHTVMRPNGQIYRDPHLRPKKP